MRHLLIAGAMALATLALGACSGCAPLQAAFGDKPIAGQTVLDEKAMYAVEAALFGANTAAEAAVDAGVIVPGSGLAVRIADHLATAKTAVDAARAAYLLGEATTFNARVDAARSAIGAAWSLIPTKAKAP